MNHLTQSSPYKDTVAVMVAEAVRTCSIEGCSGKHEARGMCNVHYTRWRLKGDAQSNIPPMVRHHMSEAETYNVWNAMKRRCYNPKAMNYPYYGGRGIIICKDWKESFRAFVRDMGLRPAGNYRIDRIDNEKGYEPGNCRWITHAENIRKSTTAKLDEGKAREIMASKKSCKTLAEEYGVSPGTIYSVREGKTWAVA